VVGDSSSVASRRAVWVRESPSRSLSWCPPGKHISFGCLVRVWERRVKSMDGLAVVVVLSLDDDDDGRSRMGISTAALRCRWLVDFGCWAMEANWDWVRIGK